jgi:hypothetical protein
MLQLVNLTQNNKNYSPSFLGAGRQRVRVSGWGIAHELPDGHLGTFVLSHLAYD